MHARQDQHLCLTYACKGNFLDQLLNEFIFTFKAAFLYYCNFFIIKAYWFESLLHIC